MNLIFFGLLDMIRSYFNESFPQFEYGFDSNFLVEGWINLQDSIESLSGTDASIASAPVLLLVAASRIGIVEKTKRYAIKVLTDAKKNEISAGKDPMGLAAAALYLSCVKNGDDKTQRDIAEAANVTEVTIRNRYKGLKDLLDI